MQVVCNLDTNHKITVHMFGKGLLGKKGGIVVHIVCADCRTELATIDTRTQYTKKLKPLEPLIISKDWDFNHPQMTIGLNPLGKLVK